MPKYEIPLKGLIVIQAPSPERALELSWEWRKLIAKTVAQGGYTDFGLCKISLGPGPRPNEIDALPED
jgi:hypothetical protein